MPLPEGEENRRRTTAGKVAAIVGIVFVSLLLLVGLCFVFVATQVGY